MNVTLEKIDNVSARLIVAVQENDYQEKVTQEIKHIGRTHAIPGFRKGHVPFSELNRRFGKQVARCMQRLRTLFRSKESERRRLRSFRRQRTEVQRLASVFQKRYQQLKIELPIK